MDLSSNLGLDRTQEEEKEERMDANEINERDWSSIYTSRNWRILPEEMKLKTKLYVDNILVQRQDDMLNEKKERRGMKHPLLKDALILLRSLPNRRGKDLIKECFLITLDQLLDSVNEELVITAVLESAFAAVEWSSLSVIPERMKKMKKGIYYSIEKICTEINQLPEFEKFNGNLDSFPNFETQNESIIFTLQECIENAEKSLFTVELQVDHIDKSRLRKTYEGLLTLRSYLVGLFDGLEQSLNSQVQKQFYEWISYIVECFVQNHWNAIQQTNNWKQLPNSFKVHFQILVEDIFWTRDTLARTSMIRNLSQEPSGTWMETSTLQSFDVLKETALCLQEIESNYEVFTVEKYVC